mgnify:FL=1
MEQVVTKVAAWLAANQKKRSKLFERIAIFGIGVLGNRWSVWYFDYVLYPQALDKFGLTFGSLIMTVASFIVCLLFILFYDWTKKDWLGIETLKEMREGLDKRIVKIYWGWNVPRTLWTLVWWLVNFLLLNPTKAILRFSIRHGYVPTMIGMSIVLDPFITTVYMRHGAHQYNGMTKRDWKHFLISLLIGNAWWTMVAFGILKSVQFLWDFIPPTWNHLF